MIVEVLQGSFIQQKQVKDRDEGLESFDEQIKVFNGKSKNVSKDIKDVEKRFTTVLRNIHPQLSNLVNLCNILLD